MGLEELAMVGVGYKITNSWAGDEFEKKYHSDDFNLTFVFVAFPYLRVGL